MLCAVLVAAPMWVHSESPNALNLGVVPQFTATETLQRWTPMIDNLQSACGRAIHLQYSKSIPAFESQFLNGSLDLAFMNPYHAVMAHRAQGYVPLVRDNKQRLKGVLVVRADSPYQTPQDLAGQTIAFPAPNAFGASLLMRAVLERDQNVHFAPVYAKTHSNAYRYVLTGQAAAAGGVQATLSSESEDIRSQLRVLFETPASAPHPLSAHPRLDVTLRTCLENAVLQSTKSPQGQTALDGIQMSEPVPAVYVRDYAPLERLSLEALVEKSPSH
jgi:phosphonate transport system substrate-binding protein